MLREVSKAGKETVIVCGDNKIQERLAWGGLTDKVMMVVGRRCCLKAATGRRGGVGET